LLGSEGLPNSVKTHLVTINNHNGKVNKEIRLIYGVDQVSKIPIFFIYIAGNIIDNSTLMTTFKSLQAFDINFQIVIMDLGYFFMQNIEQLVKQYPTSCKNA
jgi:transposase